MCMFWLLLCNPHDLTGISSILRDGCMVRETSEAQAMARRMGISDVTVKVEKDVVVWLMMTMNLTWREVMSFLVPTAAFDMGTYSRFIG